MAAVVIVGLEVRGESDETRRLVTCMVRRLIGDDEATPDTRPSTTPIQVQAEAGTDVPAIAERVRDDCADELGIAEAWELVGVLRP